MGPCRPLYTVAILLALSTSLSQCAAKLPPVAMTELIVTNTGSYTMQAPRACYYQAEDEKKCLGIGSTMGAVLAGQNIKLKIKTQQQVRLVLPFDVSHSSGGKVYRPNCHILIDLFASQEKRYFIDAQMVANLNQPENGFNCSAKVYEQNVTVSGLTEKTISKNSKKTIRYRVPRDGEYIDGYISNYNWQQPLLNPEVKNESR